MIFAVTRERFRMVVSGVRRAALAERVHTVRRAIEKVAAGESVLFLRDVDPEVLHSLYRDLLRAGGRAPWSTSTRCWWSPTARCRPSRSSSWSPPTSAAERAAFEGAKAASDGSAQHPYLVEYAAARLRRAQAALRLPAQPVGAHLAAPLSEARAARQARPGGVRRPGVLARCDARHAAGHGQGAGPAQRRRLRPRRGRRAEDPAPRRDRR